MGPRQRPRCRRASATAPPKDEPTSTSGLKAASASGLYFAHPKSRYFSVGKIGRDQVAEYAARRGVPIEEVERWLAPNLGYEPA